jgi:hypothetical protein
VAVISHNVFAVNILERTILGKNGGWKTSTTLVKEIRHMQQPTVVQQ